MRRRTLLAALWSGGASGLLAGCTDTADRGTPTAAEDRTVAEPTATEASRSQSPETGDDSSDSHDHDPAIAVGTEPCHGTWFDTHVHHDEPGFVDPLAGRMDANDVGCSVLFTHMNPDDPEGSFDDLRESVSPHPGRFVPFFQVDPQQPSDMRRERLERAYDYAPDAFQGIGEVAFYRPPFHGRSLTETPWPGVFEFAADHDLFVMLHLTVDQAAGFERMLDDHPDTSVLLHGFELRSSLRDRLLTYPQLHFTLDTATLLTTREGPLMFPGPGGDAADRFVDEFDAQRDELLETAVQDWLPVLEAAPERVMWGTDAAFEWHLEPRVYDRLVEFSAAFVDRLPAELREPFAFGNAARLFDGGVVLDEADDDPHDDHD